MRSRLEAFSADGEPAEQVAGLIAKTDVFKNSKTIWRCSLHSGQKSLENILKSDQRTECLVQHLVTGFGNPAVATEPGNMSSFARALSNSPKLRGRFRDAVNKDLDVLCELTCHGQESKLSQEFLEVWLSSLGLRQFQFSSSSVLLARQDCPKP